MSIFSRLFNKGTVPDGEQESSVEGQDDEGVSKESVDDPNLAAPDSKKSMRPTAPSFQINPPSDEPSSPGVVAAPVMQVGAGDKRIARSSRPPRRASAPDVSRPTPQPAHGALAQGSERSSKGPKARVGTSTMVMGSSFTAGSGATVPPAPYAPPPSQAAPKPSTGEAQSPPGPPPSRSRLPGSRPKLQKDAANFAVPVSKPPPRGAPLPREEPDELLTLEFGSSPSASAPPFGRMPSGKPTSQGLAPQAHSATAAANVAATTPMFTDLDPAGLVNDLDAAFGAIVESVNGAPRRLRPSESPPPMAENTELRELFTALAANHMRQVRDFMIGVKWGEAPRDWVGLCGPAVTSLQRAAKEMELHDLHAALEGYSASLRHATEAAGATIAGEERDGLMLAYAKLAELMPDAFGLEGERGKREAIIVHALLQMVPELRKNTIDKLYAAGLSNLETLFLAKADEISATTGIAEGLASTIVERIRRYREESIALADATHSAERQRLAELASEMRKLHHEFELAAADWSEDAHACKKQLRQSRADSLLQVKVLLARLGEVDRLGLLERLPFEHKIEQIESYLREAKETRQAPVT